MNKKACLLACSLSLSALMFTGCSDDNDNNGITTKNTGRGNRIITHNVNDTDGRYTTRSTGYRSNGIAARENMENAGRDLGDAARDMGRGISRAARNVGDDVGDAARDLTGMDNRTYTRNGNRYYDNGNDNGFRDAGGNLSNAARNTGRELGNAARNTGRGIANATRGVGENIGQAARDLTGMNTNPNGTGTTRTYGTNGNERMGTLGAGNALGMNRNNGIGNGTGHVTGNVTGTAPMNTNTTAVNNRDVLVLGNLVVYANGANKNNAVGQAGQTALVVTNAKAVDAIHRVNKHLNGANANTKASTIASDIRYILNHARPEGRR